MPRRLVPLVTLAVALSALRAIPPADAAPPTLAEAGAPAGVRVGLATAGRSDEQEAVIAREANVVVNHQFSWVGMEPARGTYDFTKADREYAFARDHGMFQIAMHFAWDQGLLDDLPSWVEDIDDPDELRTVLKGRAEAIFDRYPDLQMIDVINEPFETVGSELVHNHFYEVLGPDYIDELFAIVEDVAPPTVKLIVNEGGVEYLPEKAANLVELAAHLQAAGHRIDGIGFQTHLAMGEPSWRTLYDAMAAVSDLGLGAYITELDVPTPPAIADRDAVQSERYRRAAQVCLAVPTCTILDVWGVSDEPSWYENDVYAGLDPLLFDADFAPKPSYAALRDALAEGRPAGPGPPEFLRDSPRTDATGHVETTYLLRCRPDAGLTPSGYGDLSHVEELYLEGNGLVLPVTASVTWDAIADDAGRIRYQATLGLDPQRSLDRLLLETAQPAVGLGGHQDLLQSTWLRLASTGATIGFPGGSRAGVDLAADTRSPNAAATVDLAWSTVHAGPPGLVQVGPPTITTDLHADLGVVFQGQEVSGSANGTWTCTAEGDLLSLQTAVGAVDGVAAPPTAAGAEPLPGTPTFTG